MSHVNAFCRVRNSAGRSVSVGGRGSADHVSGWFNVATRAGEVSADFRAVCTGRGMRAADRRRKDIGDDRGARFVLTLPDVSQLPADAVTVELRDGAESFRSLAHMGAFLVTMQTAINLADGIASGEITDGAAGAAAARARVDAVAALIPPVPTYPRVILPGGVDMAEALAALAWVRADPALSGVFDASRDMVPA